MLTNSNIRRQFSLSLRPVFKFVSIAVLLGVSVSAVAQTAIIGSNEYAFRHSGQPNYGLFFNATDLQYEFRNSAANGVFAIDATTGYLNTNLRFGTNADLLIPTNRYAFRSAANGNYGLYFSNTHYEFRNGAAAGKLRIEASSGNLTTDGNITSAGPVIAPGGNSNQWNAAFSWGNHAAQGYLSSESDPQVGTNTTHYVPRWNGSALVSGNIMDNGSTVTMTNTTTVNAGFNSSGTASGLRVGNPNSLFIGLDNNEIQAYSGTSSDALLYLNYWGGDINFGFSTMFMDRSTGRFGIGTTSPTSKLQVVGSTTSTEHLIVGTANYSGNVDVRGVSGHAITADGYGIGVTGDGGYMGVRGVNSGGTYVGTSYGVYGAASGTAGTRIGVYGSAFGGNTNWAGYFAGNTYTTGNVHIGTIAGATGYRLAVSGKMIGTEVKVQAVSNWPDYVFDENYSLMSLDHLEEFISTNKHLPGIPSAKEVEENDGIELGEMQRLTIEKLEELTLYILELKAENQTLKTRIEALEK